MDGTQIIKIAKPQNPKTCFIMMTAYYEESYNEIFKNAGADCTIYKHIQLAELDKKTQELLHL